MKYLVLIFLFLCPSCVENKKRSHYDSSRFVEKKLLPQTLIEINSIPHPFNVNGIHPYVVWVNGQRVDLPRDEVLSLINKIGAENIKPPSNKDIHLGIYHLVV